METTTIIVYLVVGAVGALLADVMKDNRIELPKVIDDKLFLGCVGGMLTGAIAGLIVDGSPLTAFMGGYAGKEMLAHLLNYKAKDCK